MTNRDILNRKHPEEIEMMLGYLLMDYWDKLKEHGDLDKFNSSPVNIVTVYKDFLRKETLIDPEIYDMMHPQNMENEEIIDGDFRELE